MRKNTKKNSIENNKEKHNKTYHSRLNDQQKNISLRHYSQKS